MSVKKRLRLAPVLLSLQFLLAAAASTLAPSAQSQGGADRDFAEYLVGRDLVVEGVFQRADTLRRKSIGGCGIDLPTPTRSFDLHVRVENVIFGTAEDSTLVISTLGQSQFPPRAIYPGARVIAWAGRDCADGWRLWGNMVIITPSDVIVGDYNAQGLYLHGQPEGRPMTYEALQAALTALSSRHSANYFVGKSAVALVKVTHLIKIGPGRVDYECDSLGWVMGEAARVPKRLRVTAGNLGCEGARAGDSLLVPVAAGSPGDTVALPGCPGAMLVKNGFARGLGVPITFLPYALKSSSSGLEVRPVISRK